MKAELIITGSAAHIESLEADADRLARSHGLFSTKALEARFTVDRVRAGLPEHFDPTEDTGPPPLDTSDTVTSASDRLRALQYKAEAAFKRHGFFSCEAIHLRLGGYYLEARIAASLSSTGAA